MLVPLLSLLGSVCFASMFVLVHFIRKDLRTLHDVLSKYAIGPGGWLLTLGLYSMGLAQILLSVGLMSQTGHMLGSLLLSIAGAGVLIVATYPLEIKKSKSLAGYVHDLGAGIEFLFFPFSLLITDFSFNSELVFV